MSGGDCRDLKELLDRQLVALEAVLETLRRERAALAARDAAALEQIATEKQERLAAAATLERQRRELAPDPEAMERLAEATNALDGWARLLDLTRLCRDQNEENGRIIQLQQRRVENTLGLLRGRAGQSDLYGPDGANRRPGQARTPLTSV